MTRSGFAGPSELFESRCRNVGSGAVDVEATAPPKIDCVLRDELATGAWAMLPMRGQADALLAALWRARARRSRLQRLSQGSTADLAPQRVPEDQVEFRDSLPRARSAMDSAAKARNWLAATHFATAPENDDDSDVVEQTSAVNWLEEPWDTFSAHARDVLLHGRPSERARFVADVLARRTRSSTELVEQQDVVRMLVPSFARLDDGSRRAALALVRELVERSFEMDADKPSVFGALVKWAHAEITKTCAPATVSASSSRFALLELACTLLASGSDASPTPLAGSAAFPVVLASLALALDSLSRADGSTRPSLRQAAVTRTRRIIRNVRCLSSCLT